MSRTNGHPDRTVTFHVAGRVVDRAAVLDAVEMLGVERGVETSCPTFESTTMGATITVRLRATAWPRVQTYVHVVRCGIAQSASGLTVGSVVR